MNVVTIFAAIAAFSSFLHCGQCIIPLIPAAVAGIASVAVAGLGYMSICNFKECCTDEYILSNLTLKDSMQSKFHDQHLASKIVLNALESHLEGKSQKALAMIFHGSTGTGKNLLASLIVNELYKKGDNSNYVQFYNGHLDVLPAQSIEQRQHRISEDIKKKLALCPRSIFIFDKVDQMQEGILDALVPFLDYHPQVQKIISTQAIFIFISNRGATAIEEQLTRVWEAGKRREESGLENFEHLLATTALHEPGGFRNSRIIELDLIDYYVPFLPLEQVHVRKCIKDAFERRDIQASREKIDELMALLTFGPPPHNLYSKSGCKLVDPKVSAFIETERHTNRRIKRDG